MIRLGNSLNLAKTEGHQKLTQSFTIYPMQPNKTNVSFGPIIDKIGPQQIFSISIHPTDTDCFDTTIHYTARVWKYSNDGRTFQGRDFQVKDNLSDEFVYYDQQKQSKEVLIEREVDHNTGFVRFFFCLNEVKTLLKFKFTVIYKHVENVFETDKLFLRRKKNALPKRRFQMRSKRPAKRQKTTSIVSESTESFIDLLKREQIDYQYNELELDDFYVCEKLESTEWLDSVRASIASPPNVDLSMTFDDKEGHSDWDEGWEMLGVMAKEYDTIKHSELQELEP